MYSFELCVWFDSRIIYDWIFFKVETRYKTNEPNQPLLCEETQFLSHVTREKIHSEIDLPKYFLEDEKKKKLEEDRKQQSNI